MTAVFLGLVAAAGFGAADFSAVRSWRLIVLAGVLQVIATLAVVLATREGLLSLVVVVVALSPAMTMALTRLILRESVTRPQLLGVAVGLAGVALIAGG